MSDVSSNTINPMLAKDNTTIVYTDGACKGNPGAGGWGAYLIFSDGSTQDLYGGETDTTNNRMELMGAIAALKHSPEQQKLEIWTDSSYVKKGITEWVANWKARGWKTASKKSVANQDLWQQLDELNSARKVAWYWVKGHAGHAGNEKADELANLGVTSSSAQDTNNAIKKKPSIAIDVINDDTASEHALHDVDNANKAQIADDWLSFDPLGLDEGLDEALDDDFEEGLVTDLLAGNDALISEVEQNCQPYQTVDNYTDSHANTVCDTPIKAMDLKNMTVDTLNSNNNLDAELIEEGAKFDGDTSRANPNFRALLPKPIHRGETDRQLIMDTETTGLDALKGDRVIEVGIVEMVARKFTGEKLHVYINPQRGMDDEVIRIHGISEAFLTDKPTFDQVAQSLYDFMDGAEIIAHNASFDMSFLTMEFNRVGMADFAQRVQVTDSLVMAKQQYPGQKNTLDALVRRLNVGKQDRTFHGALLDSEILAEVYLAMTGGQVTLAIEEDSQSDGGQATHANFAALASLLLNSSSDEAGNQVWFTNLAQEHPEIKVKMSQW